MKLAESGGFPAPFGLQQQRLETRSFHVVRNLDSRDIAESREQIDKLDQSVAPSLAVVDTPGTRTDKDANVDLVVGLLAPTAVFAKFPTVVAPNDHDRILVQLNPRGPAPAFRSKHRRN